MSNAIYFQNSTGNYAYGSIAAGIVYLVIGRRAKPSEVDTSSLNNQEQIIVERVENITALWNGSGSPVDITQAFLNIAPLSVLRGKYADVSSVQTIEQLPIVGELYTVRDSNTFIVGDEMTESDAHIYASKRSDGAAWYFTFAATVRTSNMNVAEPSYPYYPISQLIGHDTKRLFSCPSGKPDVYHIDIDRMQITGNNGNKYCTQPISALPDDFIPLMFVFTFAGNTGPEFPSVFSRLNDASAFSNILMYYGSCIGTDASYKATPTRVYIQYYVQHRVIYLNGNNMMQAPSGYVDTKITAIG